MAAEKKNSKILKRKPRETRDHKQELLLKNVQYELPKDWSNCAPDDMDNPLLYINRELSWLEFNQRVLNQAYEENHPLLERVKFLAITGTNLDEFFMVRISTIMKKLRAGLEDVTTDGFSTSQLITAIRDRAQKMKWNQLRCWEDNLRPLLKQEQIHFLEQKDFTKKIKDYLSDYFISKVFPTITPLAFDPGHPFPHISNLSLNLAVVVRHNKQTKFARVKIPDMLTRFIELPAELCVEPGNTFVFLEDVIIENVHTLFPDTEVLESYMFRVVRDTDIEIQEDEADDLLASVDHSLKQLRHGAVSLLKVEESMPQHIIDILEENFSVRSDVIFRFSRRMNFGQWWELMRLHRPKLKDPSFQPPVLFDDREIDTVFDRIKIEDHLVHHPYESFTSVETFLKAACYDPNVVAIKMTLYRIGSNSPIVDHLIQARELGIQVAVLVELKARFDERNNITWAQRLEAVGVHVVYGLLKLKTHCKLCLVVRKEHDGIRRYVHVATGNYNRATSRIYTDLGIFTANEEIGADVSEVFNYLTGYSNKSQYNRLLVSPVTVRSGISKLIEQEIEHAKAGKKAYILCKCNGLTDESIVKLLYKASQAGVKVDLIIRGICILRPGIPGISDNINVISIVGRFLEHHRAYYFHNDGNEIMYIGSADLMPRNLDRRVEALVNVDAPILRQIKTHLLDVMLRDNVRACRLNTDGSYSRILPNEGEEQVDAQSYLLNYYTSK